MRTLPDFVFFHELVYEDGLGLELVAPMHDRDALGDIGEVERLFHGGVAAANDRHVLAFKEKIHRRWRSPTHRGP